MTSQVTRQQILDSMGASYWLKAALKASADRDIVDALRDAEILASILRSELTAMNGRAEGK